MLKDQIKKDSLTALKEGNKIRVDILRYLISLIEKRELALPSEGMNEAEELMVLKKELKNKEEAREMFLKAGREELVKQEDEEIRVLRSYLPPELSAEEIRKKVEAIVASQGKDFALVMKSAMIDLKGQADGAVVATLVRQVIDEQ